MNIASGKLDELARRLSKLTGEDLETALERAVAERLERVSAPDAENRTAALNAFFDEIAKMAPRDTRTADEIVGYDRNGLPS